MRIYHIQKLGANLAVALTEIGKAPKEAKT